MPRTVLLVDEDAAALSHLRRTLHGSSYRVLSARSTRAAFEVLAIEPVHVIVSGATLAEASGIEFLARVRLRHPNTVRMVIASGTDGDAIKQAVQQGAVHFSLAPSAAPEELVQAIDRGVEQLDLLHETQRLLRAVRRRTRVVDEIEGEKPGCSPRPR